MPLSFLLSLGSPEVQVLSNAPITLQDLSRSIDYINDTLLVEGLMGVHICREEEFLVSSRGFAKASHASLCRAPDDMGVKA